MHNKLQKYALLYRTTELSLEICKPLIYFNTQAEPRLLYPSVKCMPSLYNRAETTVISSPCVRITVTTPAAALYKSKRWLIGQNILSVWMEMACRWENPAAITIFTTSEILLVSMSAEMASCSTWPVHARWLLFLVQRFNTVQLLRDRVYQNVAWKKTQGWQCS